MSDSDLAFAGIIAQAELLRSRKVSARELITLYLDRIERLDPILNAFRIVFAEQSLRDADAADALIAAGEDRPLLGVPVAIKDGWDVAGEVTSHGTGAYGPPARKDSEFVRRLREAGAVIIGKTNQPELALWMFTESETWGATRNPWNTGYIPGGSSGGSAAAVAAGLVGAASASDGAGSIRLPATACGLFGLKPQRGRVPTSPYLDHWHGLTAVGCLTRSVADTALWLDVVSGPYSEDPESIPALGETLTAAANRYPGTLRIAVSKLSPTGAPLALVLAQAVDETADLLRTLGHVVTERDPSYAADPGDQLGDVAGNLAARYLRGVADDASRLAHPERLMALTRQVVRHGASIDDVALRHVRAAEAAIASRLNGVFADHDVLLCPVVGEQPFKVGAHADRDAPAWFAAGRKGFSGLPFLAAWNVTGQPAASVPAGFDPDGVPLAVQLVGRADDEATLISLSAQLEAERPWTRQRPALAEVARAS